jgi:hypothetical protein
MNMKEYHVTDCYKCGEDAQNERGLIYMRVNTDNVVVCYECWRKTRNG